MFDDDNWALRSVVVDTRRWLPGKHVVLSPAQIDHVSWEDREVYVKIPAMRSGTVLNTIRRTRSKASRERVTTCAAATRPRRAAPVES